MREREREREFSLVTTLRICVLIACFVNFGNQVWYDLEFLCHHLVAKKVEENEVKQRRGNYFEINVLIVVWFR